MKAASDSKSVPQLKGGVDDKIKKSDSPDVGLAALFFGFSGVLEYATRFDLFVLAIGSLGAVGAGLAQPALMVLFGSGLDDFGATPTSDEMESTGSMKAAVSDVCLKLVFAGLIFGFGSYVQNVAWNWAGTQISQRVRTAHLKAILRQDSAWFDSREFGSICTEFTECTTVIQRAITTRAGMRTTLLNFSERWAQSLSSKKGEIYKILINSISVKYRRSCFVRVF
jgi:ABC-type multidrug transport system fused ATPase/permease subunit